MVVFVCSACGDSLKKAQVEKHYQTQCRNCNMLACMDCNKEFWGDEYKAHTKCISEEEKYSGKNWKPKPGANKGEAKQDAWLQQVQNAIDQVPSNNHNLKSVLEKIKDYPNIPRKKAKFENFLKNSIRVWDTKLATNAWDALQSVMNEQKAETLSTTPVAEEKINGSLKSEPSTETEVEEKKLSKRERKEERRKKQGKEEKKNKRKHSEEEECEAEEVKKKKKSKKRKHEEEEADLEKKKHKKDSEEEDEGIECDTTVSQDDEEVVPEPKHKFNWEQVIIAVLKAADGEIAVKKLKKKVLAEYRSQCGETKGEEKLEAKFNKKTKKNPKFKMLKDKVKLMS